MLPPRLFFSRPSEGPTSVCSRRRGTSPCAGPPWTRRPAPCPRGRPAPGSTARSSSAPHKAPGRARSRPSCRRTPPTPPPDRLNGPHHLLERQPPPPGPGVRVAPGGRRDLPPQPFDEISMYACRTIPYRSTSPDSSSTKCSRSRSSRNISRRPIPRVVMRYHPPSTLCLICLAMFRMLPDKQFRSKPVCPFVPTPVPRRLPSSFVNMPCPLFFPQFAQIRMFQNLLFPSLGIHKIEI